MQEYVIKNATLCDQDGERVADLKIFEGKIAQIGSNLHAPHQYDAQGLHLLPSLIDLNIKPKSYKHQDLKKLEKKALKGGVGTLALTLQSDPPSGESLSLFNLQSPAHFICNITPYTHKIQDISKLHKNGGSFLQFASHLPTSALLCIYDYAKLLHIPCFCEAKDLELSERGSVESEMSYKMGLSSMPEYLQSLEFAKIIQMASFKHVPTLLHAIHDVHVLNALQNKEQLFSEVSIHHLIANETSIQGYNTWGKLNPPLCTSQIQHALREHLSLIDTLTSAHQEFSTSQKEQTFDDAISGIECLEFYFPLLYTHLVRTHLLSLSALSKKCSLTQAQLLHLNRGLLQEGYEADLILVDLNEHFEYFHPLYGTQTLYGKVKALYSSKGGMHANTL